MERDRIVDQLRRAVEKDAWHGPALAELLRGVTATQAAARPIAGAHSIWEIVLHLLAWRDAVRRRLLGQDRAQLGPAEDWPEVGEPTPARWKQLLGRLETAHEALGRAIAGVEDGRLDQPILSGMSSLYVNLHGQIQHETYHAGQIALLRRALAIEPSA